MRNLLIAFVLVLAASCGSNGPDTNPNGVSPCRQLRECLCDPERNPTDPVACNANVDALAQSADPDTACRVQMTFFCGQPVQVDLSGAGI